MKTGCIYYAIEVADENEELLDVTLEVRYKADYTDANLTSWPGEPESGELTLLEVNYDKPEGINKIDIENEIYFQTPNIERKCWDDFFYNY